MFCKPISIFQNMINSLSAQSLNKWPEWWSPPSGVALTGSTRAPGFKPVLTLVSQGRSSGSLRTELEPNTCIHTPATALSWVPIATTCLKQVTCFLSGSFRFYTRNPVLPPNHVFGCGPVLLLEGGGQYFLLMGNTHTAKTTCKYTAQ